MSGGGDLLAELRALGAAVRLDGDGLVVEPASALGEDLRERVRAGVAGLLDALRGEAEAAAPPGTADALRVELSPVETLDAVLRAREERAEEREVARAEQRQQRHREQQRRYGERAMAEWPPEKVRAMAAEGKLTAEEVRRWDELSRALDARIARRMRLEIEAAALGQLFGRAVYLVGDD